VASYLDDLHARFEAAARRHGVVERHYRIAGQAVRLRLGGGDVVEPLTRALEHQAADAVPDPSLTICVADGTMVEPPRSPWEPAAPAGTATSGAGENPAADGKPTLHVRDDAVAALFQLDYPAMSLYDRAGRTGFFWTASADLVPAYERASPLRAIFHWWGLEFGWHVVHAGAVGRADGGVLLVGKAGSGKSTAALACLGAGLAYLGDNDALLAAGVPPFVHGLYCAGKLDEAHLRRRLPHLLPLVGAGETRHRGKDVFFLDAARGTELTTGFPLRAVLIPKVTGAARATVRRVPPSAAVVALAPSTLLQLPGAHAERLRHLAGVLRGVPAYGLELGEDVSSVAAAVEQVLEAPA
jgi:hypothetical protein